MINLMMLRTKYSLVACFIYICPEYSPLKRTAVLCNINVSHPIHVCFIKVSCLEQMKTTDILDWYLICITLNKYQMYSLCAYSPFINQYISMIRHEHFPFLKGIILLWSKNLHFPFHSFPSPPPFFFSLFGAFHKFPVFLFFVLFCWCFFFHWRSFLCL